ncbi:MAG: hypothetical protein O0W85_07975 [Methanocorpusculum sp.]|nr:hypothetical protein [Methanocorpusculum sp.]
MTTQYPTPAAVLTAVQHTCPPPGNPYEEALWHTRLAETCETLAADARSIARSAINTIETNGITHPDYTIIRPVKTISRVNLDKLKTLFPRIAEKLTHIRACDAEKLIGRTELCHLTEEIAGDRILPYLRINISDLAKELSPAELPAYLITTQKPLDPCIIRREDTHVLV